MPRNDFGGIGPKSGAGAFRTMGCFLSGGCSFRVVGEEPMRLLGTHVSPRRIVNYRDGSATDAHGYRLVDR